MSTQHDWHTLHVEAAGDFLEEGWERGMLGAVRILCGSATMKAFPSTSGAETIEYCILPGDLSPSDARLVDSAEWRCCTPDRIDGDGFLDSDGEWHVLVRAVEDDRAAAGCKGKPFWFGVRVLA